MKLNKKKAYSLSELLVVVMVVGVLSAVAVPKMKQAVETRRTTEAENIISAVRTEQEQRCVFGKEYQTTTAKVDVLADAKKSPNYTYSLQSTGVAAKAKSGKDYTIKMKSYKTGQLCCEGAYCANLNKSYPLCDNVSVPVDECAGDTSCSSDPDQPKCCNPSEEKWDGSKCVELTPCEKTPNSCACSTFASANYEKCSPDSCTNNPNQEKCCVGNEIWEGGKCIDYCATAPNSCKCKTYASSHYEECAEDSCTNNPNQQKCCTSSQEWSGGKCVDLCSLYAGTCKCPTYAESHYEQCDANSCTNNPNQDKCCDYSQQKWDGSKCVALTACELNPNACTCQTYYDSHIEECDANSCTNRPNQAKCCDPATEIWDGEAGYCAPKPPCPGEKPEAETTDCRFGCGTQVVEYECSATAKEWIPVYGECSTKSGYSEECAPGSTRSQSCNNVGTQIKTCTEKCAWGEWETCDCGTPTNDGKQSYSEACPYGYSGSVDYTWNAKTCTYDVNNTCVQDPCPHEEEPSPTTQDCNYGCGTQSVTWQCNEATRKWEPVYGECGAKSGYKLECAPGATTSQVCNGVGTQGRECSSKCTWGAWETCDCGTPTNDGKKSYTESCAYGHSGIKTYTWNTTTCKYDLKDTCVKDDCPHEERPADTTEACGNCGTRSVTYSCNVATGKWKANYGTCSGEGVCSPGATSSTSSGCNGYAEKTRTCNSSCQWGTYGSCQCNTSGSSYTEACPSGYTGSGYKYTWDSSNSVCDHVTSGGCSACECNPGATQSQTCKNYGTQTRTCKSDGTCSWGSWSECSCPASVAPNGASYTASCPADHTGNITYTWNTSTCSYDVKNTCVAEDCPSSQRPKDYTESCGNCGTRSVTYYCNTAAKKWTPSYGTCNGQGTCSPGATSSTSSGCNGYAEKTRTCNSSCQWGSYGSCQCNTSLSDYTTSCPSGSSGSGYKYTWDGSNNVCNHVYSSGSCTTCTCSGSETQTESTGVGAAYRVRTCNGCTWGAWTTKCDSRNGYTESCGSGQTGSKTYTWNNSTSVCDYQLSSNTCKSCECSGSQTRTMTTGCQGNGYKTSTCDGCSWGTYGNCVCGSAPNGSSYTESCPSGYSGSITYTWRSSNAYCSYKKTENCTEWECTPGSTKSQSCKGVGTQTSTCNSSGTAWGDWSTCSCPSSVAPSGASYTGSCGSGYSGKIKYTWNTSTCSYDSDSSGCSKNCDESTKPASSQSCGCKSAGTQTRTVTCNNGTWVTGNWSTCSVASGVCDSSTRPLAVQICGCKNGGTMSRSVSCNADSCEWEYGPWGSCSTSLLCSCDKSTKPISSQTCGCKNAGTQTRDVTCNTSTGTWEIGRWGLCSAGVCTCDESLKQITSAFCGCNNKGTKTRSRICDLNTGEWVLGSWGDCSMPAGYGSACTAGETETRTCTTNSKHSQKRTCTAYCNWGSWGSCSCTAQPTKGTSYTESCPSGQTGQKTYTWNTTTCTYALTSNTCKAASYGWVVTGQNYCNNCSRCQGTQVSQSGCRTASDVGKTGIMNCYDDSDTGVGQGIWAWDIVTCKQL